jgi:hypothetical protein
VLYSCEKLSLTLREEFRLRLFENKILMSMSEPKNGKNMDWIMLLNKEINSFTVLLK